MVAQIAQDVPGLSISGIGGVTCGKDAIEHILLGASTVQSCTGAMLQGFPFVENLCKDLEAFMEKHEFEKVEDMVGHSLQYYKSQEHLQSLMELKKEKKQR